MSRSLLLIISSDPETDPRPAEALRIGAGIGAWDRIRVAVYLHGPAARSLSSDAEWFQDGDCIVEALPLLVRNGSMIGVEPNRLPERNRLEEIGRDAPGGFRIIEVDARKLNEWIHCHDTVVRF